MIKQERLRILSNAPVAPGHFTIEFESPRIARAAEPGQFVQVLADDYYEPLLPRPFSFLDVTQKSFKILYQIVGKGTRLISEKKKGDSLVVLGPLGRGFSRAKNAGGVGLVGGGVGIPPLFHLAKVLLADKKLCFKPKDIHVFLGARNKSLLHCEKEFKRMGVDLRVVTDDGSRGQKGFVTQLVDEFLTGPRAAVGRSPVPGAVGGRGLVLRACGPTPMLAAVSQLAAKYETPCEVSVEEPMPCGFGACLGCAIKVKASGKGAEDGQGYRYAISCCEGPVFDSCEVIWQ